MDDCEHGFPQFLCRRCDGNDRSDPAVPSGLAGQVNPDNDEQIDVAEHRIFDTIAAAEEVHDPLEGLVEKTAENITSAMQQHTPTVLPVRARGSR